MSAGNFFWSVKMAAACPGVYRIAFPLLLYVRFVTCRNVPSLRCFSSVIVLCKSFDISGKKRRLLKEILHEFLAFSNEIISAFRV
jgi:hypothetical protein